jgi:hemerythrin
MSRLAWSDDLATGVDQIDAHNQSLFFVLNELFASDFPCEMRSRMCHKIEDTIVYLTRNFLSEEALMADCGYADVYGHRNEHRVLLDELLRLQRTLQCGRYDTSEMFDLLSSWALAHIEIWDKPLGRHLRPKASAATPTSKPFGQTGSGPREHAEVGLASSH